MGSKINIGVIGYGYWGPNLVRNFAEIPGAQVTGVSDFKPELLAKAQARCLGRKVSTDSRDASKGLPSLS